MSSARYSAGKDGDEPPSDYLSDATRKVRRALLLACVAGLAYANGFKPTAITTLSIKFDEIDQSKISWLLIGVVTYFLVEFLTFVRKDYVHLLYGGEQYPVARGQEEVVPYSAWNNPRYGWEFVLLKFKTPAMLRWELGNWSFGFSVPGFPSARLYASSAQGHAVLHLVVEISLCKVGPARPKGDTNGATERRADSTIWGSKLP